MYKWGAHSWLDTFAGQTKKTPQADFTEQNLEYFKKATWKIKKETYNKVKPDFELLLSILNWYIYYQSLMYIWLCHLLHVGHTNRVPLIWHS